MWHCKSLIYKEFNDQHVGNTNVPETV